MEKVSVTKISIHYYIKTVAIMLKNETTASMGNALHEGRPHQQSPKDYKKKAASEAYRSIVFLIRYRFMHLSNNNRCVEQHQTLIVTQLFRVLFSLLHGYRGISLAIVYQLGQVYKKIKQQVDLPWLVLCWVALLECYFMLGQEIK